ncbi:hypothetical protein CTheo_93 [Ceratobasidium theobromae]|uniref:Histone H1 n=1 Tax=Ceratobasidium theobromae TaxID=1582974 RepID=A0A5N5R0U5_9AGAM|nr:hypothetical protein CTheo_93 [Ceratobasidium theobromae]
MARTGTAKASSKSRATPVHPSFIDMIVPHELLASSTSATGLDLPPPQPTLPWLTPVSSQECIVAHREDSRAGVSRPMIKKFLEEQYKIDITPSHITNINRAIARGAETNVFTLPKGPSGKVKLAPKKTSESKENHAPAAAKKSIASTKKSSTTSKRATSKATSTPKKATSTARTKKLADKKPEATKSTSTRAKSSIDAKPSRKKTTAKPATKPETTKSTSTRKTATAKKASTTRKAPTTKPRATTRAKKTTSSTSSSAKAKASGTTKAKSGRTTRGTAGSSKGSGKRLKLMSKSRLNVVMGAMTFGKPGTEGARIESVESVGEILDIFMSYGHLEVDTARVYTNGTSEELLGEAEWQKRGLIVETKLYPSGPIKHTPEGIREHLGKSLVALKTDKLELFYLHAPDRSTPFETTFKAVDDLHKEGMFHKLGISNYTAYEDIWEVSEIVTICRTNGWIQPTVYQGIYNAVHRAVEPELLPCLRKCRYKNMTVEAETGSRFDPNRTDNQPKNYRARYWREDYFRALEVIDKAVDSHGLTISECALRWINHHSLLKPEYGDAIIIGASRKDHVESVRNPLVRSFA